MSALRCSVVPGVGNVIPEDGHAVSEGAAAALSACFGYLCLFLRFKLPNALDHPPQGLPRCARPA